MDLVSISPDGTKVAFVQPVNGEYAVVVARLNPAAPIIRLPQTDQKVRALIWADATHLLVVKSYTGYAKGVSSARSEWSIVQNLDLENNKATWLFSRFRMRTMNSVWGTPQVRGLSGHTTVFASGTTFIKEKGTPALVTADLANGDDQLRDIAASPEEKLHWVFDDNGFEIAETTYDEGTHTWTLWNRQGAEYAVWYSTQAPTDQPTALGLSSDGASLVLETVRSDGGAERRLVSIANGKISPPQPQYSGFSDWIYAPESQRIIGGVKTGMESSVVFFDRKDQAAWDMVLKSFPGEQVDPVSWSLDRNKVVVKVTGIQHGIVYAVVDLVSHEATQIGQAYAGIKADDLGDVDIVRYPAKDGLPIQAFLTLPNGREPKNLPLIVLPHGGPSTHDESGFDWLAQALASRGYAVLQPQFRGSSGFDLKLEAAGFGEFGRKMQSDLSDGVRALAAKGYVDPKRVCIVGASYGGYAALTGVTIERGVYRCAVAVAGVSDMRTMIGGGEVDAEHSRTVRYWDRFVGAKDPKDPVFDQISPLKHADMASAPILLIHGKDDTVVPIDQSRKMEAALERANKPVEFVTLSKEDHWLSREATRLQMLQATVTFLEKNNPPN